MTDIAPAVHEVDHDPEEGPALDSVELVRTGVIRLVINGQKVVLRRPFFGELKALRLAWETITDDLTDLRIETEAIGAELKDEAEAIAADENLSHRDRAAKTASLRQRDREAGRALTSAGDDARAEWWVRVFTTLGVQEPEQWPSWVADATLPSRVLQHWRSAPLGRG